MANLNFPANPTVGQLHTVGDKAWTWTGVAWAIQRVSVTGKSAYELAIENGFVGTEAAWIASLKGTKGDTGAQGSQGIKGDRGDKGDPGDRGTDGTNGIDGVDGVGVPTGGTTGQILAKNSNDPFDTTWVTPDYLSDYTVPLGGNQGQFLGKITAADGDFEWLDLPSGDPSNPELPLGGNEGQVLTKNSSTSGDVKWADPVGGSGLPDGGSTGQILTKNSEFNGDATWQDAPEAGDAFPSLVDNAGKILAVKSTEDGVEWIEAPTGTGSGSTPVTAPWPPVTATGTGSAQNIILPVSLDNTYDIDVYINGIHLNSSDYSVSGTTLSLTSNAAGDSIEVRPASGGSTSNGSGSGDGSADPYYRMMGFFAASPAVNEILMIAITDIPITFPANFSGSQAKLIGMQPGANFVLSIRKNSTTEIGTLAISTTGTATFLTSGGTSKSLAIGDAISVHAPGVSDTITNLTWILRGNK